MTLKTVNLKVEDFMTTAPIAVDHKVSFPVAVSLMANKGIGNLIIKEDNKPSGILTEREILSYLVREGEIPIESMKDILTQSFVSISPKDSVSDAAKTMISKKKRLLVFENEKLVGIITASDMLRGFRKTAENPSLNNVMSTKIYQCSYNDSIFKAIKMMYKKRIGSVIVLKNDRPYGIFTERDLLLNVLTAKVDLTKRVGDYCSFPLVTEKIGIRGNDAARIMAEHKIKRLALTKEGRIIAIVTARDIVDAFHTENKSVYDDELRNQLSIIQNTIELMKGKAKYGTYEKFRENLSTIENAVLKIADQRDGSRFSSTDKKYKKILVPYDSSIYSKKALNDALEIAKKFHSTLNLLTVIDISSVKPPGMLLGIAVGKEARKLMTTVLKSVSSQANLMLENEVEVCRQQGIEAYYEVMTGSVTESILKFTEKHEIDLIVMGSRGLSGIRKIMALGSVSRKVSEEASCPVMIVK